MAKKEAKKLRVAVGLSGGVDSSVAALLLKEQGYDVVGVFIKCWDEKADGCTAEEDRASAVSVAAQLDIKFETLDYTKEYTDRVIGYFYDEYKKGRTPNPDVMCNKEIKFGMFLEWALEQGFDYVATGHYAQVEHSGGSPSKLLKGKDGSKDQSYFLYRLTQDQLSKSLFPLGGIDKSKVRKLAKKAGLSTYNRPDSQGICFIGKVNIKDFLQKEIKPKKGVVKHVNGEEIGTHDGVWYYTIGQRHGFEITKYFGLPLYVVDKNVEENELIVGFVADAVSSEFTVEDLTWISGSPPESLEKDGELKCDIRIRHLGQIYIGVVTSVGGGRLKVAMEDETFGVAAGQSAVFYDGAEVLGGGVIV